MAYLQEPIKIFENFLRSRLSELTRVGLSNRQTIDSESFDGTGAQTIFNLTIKPYAVNSITIDGTEVYPYTDFNIDLDLQKIKFRSAPGIGTDNVVISFEKGATWVYADKAREDLKKPSYPRIGMVTISEPGSFKEMGSTAMNTIVTVQFDILAYRNQQITIGSESKYDNDVSEYLARQLVKSFKDGLNPYLTYRIIDMDLIGINPVPFEPNKNIFRHMVQMSFEFRKNEETI